MPIEMKLLSENEVCLDSRAVRFVEAIAQQYEPEQASWNQCTGSSSMISYVSPGHWPFFEPSRATRRFLKAHHATALCLQWSRLVGPDVMVLGDCRRPAPSPWCPARMLTATGNDVFA